ncbi:MAG TPA: condensation domain-containing protein [Micromonosporaceae bacterium]
MTAHAGLPASQRAKLVEIWCGVLGVASIDGNDNVFGLGGDSMAAALIALRVRKMLAIRTTVQDVFDHPTLAEYAAHLAARKTAAVVQEDTPPVVDLTGLTPASLGQEAFLRLRQDPAHSSLMDSFFIDLAFRIRGPLDAPRLRQALLLVVGRYDSLRSTFVWSEGQLRLRVEPEPRLAYAYAAVTGPGDERDEQVRALIDQAMIDPFDRRHAPPISVRVYALAPEEHVLLILLDHFAADGISIELFVTDLAEAYAGLERDPDFRLGPPGPQFPQWARWQRETVRDTALAESIRYWRGKLGPSPNVVANPLPGYTGTEGEKVERVTKVIDGTAAAQIRAGAAQRNVTVFAHVLGGLLLVMWRRTGQRSFCVKTSIANRSVSWAGQVFGPLAHDIFLRTDLPEVPEPDQAAREVQRNLAEALLYGAVPDLALWTALWPDGYEYLRNPHVLYFSLNRVTDNAMLRLAGTEVSGFATNPGPSAPGVEFAVHETDTAFYFTISYKQGAYLAEDVAAVVAETADVLLGADARPTAGSAKGIAP